LFSLAIFTTGLPWPPTTGGQRQTYERIKILSKFNQVTLHCLCLDKITLEEQRDCVEHFRNLDVTIFFHFQTPAKFRFLKKFWKWLFSASPWPCILAQSSESYKETFSRAERDLELTIISEGFSPLALRTNDSSVIYFAANIETSFLRARAKGHSWFNPRRIALRLDALKMSRFEEIALQQRNVKIIAATIRDCAILQKLSGKKVEFVPFLIEPHFINKPDPENRFILLTTNLSHEPNRHGLRWFLVNVVPHLLDIKIVVTGRDHQGHLASLNKKKQIEYLGVVSLETLNSLYKTASVVVNPTMLGAGVQIKLLEPLAFGCNVVSTTRCTIDELTKIPHSNDGETFARYVNNFVSSNSVNVELQNEYVVYFENGIKSLKNKLQN